LSNFGTPSDEAISGPGVIIHLPEPSAQVTKGDSFPVLVTATDDDGVVRIDLWVDDQILLTQSSPDENGMTPFSLTYPMVAVETGTYALMAHAYNSQGEMGESLLHYVTVNEVIASTQELGQYTVQEGDTLDSIASKTGTTAEAIQQADPHISNGQVRVGQQVLVPVKGPAQAKAAAAPPQPNKPPAPPPAPVNQPAIKSIKVSASPKLVYYGQTCTNEPTTSTVFVTVDPASAATSATLKYTYFGKAGSSGELSVSMLFTADINAGKDAEKYLAQEGGWAMLWVEVLDSSGNASVSKPSTVTAINCANIIAPGGQAGGQPGGQQGGQQPGGQAGGAKQSLPGILPGFQPGAAGQMDIFIPDQDQGSMVPVDINVLPWLQPGVSDQVGIFQPGQDKVELTAPGSPTTAVDKDNCTVTINWTESPNATHYRIDRYVWGKPKPISFNSLPAGSFMDALSGAGKYGYRVSAVREQGGKTVQAPSKIMWVELSTSQACPPPPKRLFFQPLTFKPFDPSFAKGFLLVTLDGFSPLRVPRAGQNYYPTGDWSGAGEWGIPLPEGLLSKSGDQMFVEVQANGYTSKGPQSLRFGRNMRSYDELIHINAINTVWDLGAELFDFTYRMWLGDWLWGGQIADPSLPSPYNLKLSASDPLQHQLEWDYAAKDKIDGFIVYSNYSCQGGLQTSHYVITKQITEGNKTTRADQRLSIPTYKQPEGCSCSYRVSAFGRIGESKLSEAVSKDCKTGAPEAKIQVSFDEFWFYDDGIKEYYNVPQWANIYLFAGQFSRGSNQTFLKPHNYYYLQGIRFNWQLNRNRFVIPASAGESEEGKGVYKFTYGFFVEHNFCSIVTQEFEIDSAKVKSGEAIPFILKSSCGQECTCYLSGSVSALKSGQDSVSKNITESCSSDSECESGLCKNNLCTPSVLGEDEVVCFANDQCASGVCSCYESDRDNLDPNRRPYNPIPCPPEYDPQEHARVIGICQGPLWYSKYANGHTCSEDDYCASLNCVNGLCAPPEGLGRQGDYCHHDNHCYNDFCLCPTGYDGDFCAGYQNISDKPGKQGFCGVWPGAALGESCQEDDDCESRNCDKNQCVPINGHGLLGDYCISSDQCYSGRCMCPDDTYRLDSTRCTGYENFTPSTGGYCTLD
jgi:LysM repeat protein